MHTPGWRRSLRSKLSGAAVIAAASAAFWACSKSADSKAGAEKPTAEGSEPVAEQAAPPAGEAAPAAGANTPTPVADPAADPTGGADMPAALGGAKAAKPAAGGQAMGKKVITSDTYEVVVDAPDSAASGAQGKVTVTVTPKTGWKMNQEYPTKLTVTAPEGVSVGKTKLAKGDAVEFTEKKGVFAVEFTPASAGAKSFAAKLDFAVCTDATCDPKKEQLAWVVNVK